LAQEWSSEQYPDLLSFENGQVKFNTYGLNSKEFIEELAKGKINGQ